MKLSKITSIFVILVISILTLLYLNFRESNYLKLDGFNIETMSIKYSDDYSYLSDIIIKLQEVAQKNNVILVKSISDYKKDNGINLYLSLKNIEELKQLLSERFNITWLNNIESGFISTYNHDNNQQIGIINDLFQDHFYTYYLMDDMIEMESIFGSYSILYTDFQDYGNFINEANDILGYDTYCMAFYNSIENYILILIVGSLIFLMLFYFVFQIYEYYNNSKKIGCMKLLGFDVRHINRNMYHNTYIVSLLFLIISMVFVKNITLKHLLILILVNLFIHLITYLVSFISCKIIFNDYKIVNILKMENVSLKITKISYVFKSIMTILMICFIVIIYNNINILQDKLKIYNESKDLLNYGMFQTYKIEEQGNDYDKMYNLYLKIVENMETVYAQFHDYSNYTMEDLENIKQAEINGLDFIYDSVDINYLKKEDIKVYDLLGNEVSVDTFAGVCYLFPKSKIDLIESFKEFHLQLDDYYKQFNDEYVFKAYLYDDQLLDTYQVNLKYIDSSILRVIDNTIKYPSFYDGLGISFFGESTRTGLKIKLIDNDREKTLDKLFQYINDAGLSNLFSRKSFITYKDYFNDEIITSKLILFATTLTTIITLLVYILISFQLIRLYINSQRKNVLVKKLLGFSNNAIFDQIYKKNLNNTLISIVIAILILIIIKKINISFCLMPIIFLLLDFIITFLSIKSMKTSKIYLSLKGESYD